MNKPCCWALSVEGLSERTPHQVRRHHPCVHCIADHLTDVQIPDAGEIKPTFRSWHGGFEPSSRNTKQVSEAMASVITVFVKFQKIIQQDEYPEAFV